MAKTGETGNCGCGDPERQSEQVLAGQILGDDWKDIVEEIVMKDSAEQARAQLSARESLSDDEIVVEVPMTLYIGFSRAGLNASDGGTVHCVCTHSSDGVICKCIGACNFPSCCDNTPGGPPPIVVAPE